MNASRVLQGQVIYKDFFNFTLPGTELVYALLFRTFGVRAWVPNVTLIVLGVSLGWCSVLISRHLVTGGVAFLPGILFLACAFRTSADGTHHWFSALAVMAGIATIIEKRNPVRLTIASALFALASFFTQIKGITALLGLAAFLVWECPRGLHNRRSLLRNEALLFATFLVTLGGLSAYFMWKAGLQRFIDCVVIFGVKYWPRSLEDNTWRIYIRQISFPIKYRHSLAWVGVSLFIHALLPLVYVVFFVRYKRHSQASPHPWNRLMLLNMIGLSLFLGIAVAPSWIRLCSVSLPALIIFVWLVNCLPRLQKAAVRVLGTAALLFAAGACWRMQGHWRAILDTPAGRAVFMNPDAYAEECWLLSRTKPYDFVFDANWPDPYFLLHLRNPTEVPFLAPTDYTRPEQVDSAVQNLQNRCVRFVVTQSEEEAARETPSNHLGPFYAYLRRHYRVVETFSSLNRVWERIADCETTSADPSR